MQMIFESEPDDDASNQLAYEEHPDPLAWQVLLNVHNHEANPDLAIDQFTEYDMLFGQFTNNNASSPGQPPASTAAIKNLLSVAITDDTHCAICKDEICTGLMANQLPYSHRYHGDCIVKWLGIHNTCPLCLHELQSDDLNYERQRADRAPMIAKDRSKGSDNNFLKYESIGL